MILETTSVTSSIYESIGNYVVAAVIAAIGYVAKKKYDKYVEEQKILEEKKAEYNEQIIKAVSDLTTTQQKLEQTIERIVTDFEVVKQDYEKTRIDYQETQHVIMEYMIHHDNMTKDYNKTKAAVIDIQDVLRSKKYDLRIVLERDSLPVMMGYSKRNSDIT